MDAYLDWVRTNDAISVADLRAAFLAMLYLADFRATTSSYDSAVASGDIRLVPNSDFRRAMADFSRSQSTLDLILSTYHDMTYIGPLWEVVRSIGDYRVLYIDPNRLTDANSISHKFEMSESSLRELYSQPETVAMILLMRNIHQNQHYFLRELRASTLEAIAALDQT